MYDFCGDRLMKETDGWYPGDTMAKVKAVMRAKLLALRQGRIPSDDEVRHLMNVTTVSAPESSSVRPEEDEDEDEVSEDEEDEEEGEGEEENGNSNSGELNQKVDAFMANIIRQPSEFQSMSPGMLI